MFIKTPWYLCTLPICYPKIEQFLNEVYATKFCHVLKLLYSEEETTANSTGKAKMRRDTGTTFLWLIAHLSAVAAQSGMHQN